MTKAAKLHLNLIALKTVFKLFGIFLLPVLFTACTVQKSRKEMSFLEKTFTNTNARYNGYYNARELMKSSMDALDKQHRDNYSQVLEMYKYIAADNPQAVGPDLDLAMKKVSIVVNLYRRSKWTDDCYLLVGQAQFLKKDYESAESTLRYLAGEFDPNAPVAKKGRSGVSSSSSKDPSKPVLTSKQKQQLAKQKAKERKKYNRQIQVNRKKAARAKAKGKAVPVPKQSAQAAQDPKAAEKAAAEAAQKAKQEEKKAKQEASGKMKHRPAFQESELWLAKTLIERDNFDAAIRILNRLLENPKTYDEVRREAVATQAYAFIGRKDYERALPLLDQAISQSTDKKQKSRFTYIAGQLHQRAGRSAQAVAAFEQALKLTNDYEMAFNARLNIALGNAASTGSPALAKESLEKMLKDIKNEEYKDQIYFALAEIAFQAGNREEGIRNLELSLLHSKGNNAQKAEAYHTLAELYFEEEAFVKAKNYYDSTLMVLSPADERFEGVKLLAENLADVAKNLTIIAEQDSLLKIGALSPKERADMAAKIKADRDEQRRNAALAAATSANNTPARLVKGGPAPAGLSATSSGATASTSTFFAYNDREVRQGQRDFQRKWGNRPLEDNWRRSDKGIGGESIALNPDNPSLEQDADASSGPLSEAEIKELLGKVPVTPEEIAQAQLKIKEAMFNLGRLYRDKLNRLDKSADILETLNRRFPANSFELESWYRLYLVYTDLNNPPKAKEFADKIINKYPTSVYGKVLQDPTYIKELTDERRRLNAYYDQAYAAFQRGEYQRAYEQSQAAREKFGAGNPLQPKFALLSAMCTGNMQGKEAYVASLNEVMSRYPNTPEQTRAREMLRLLSGASAALPGGAQGGLAAGDGPLYLLEDDDLHYVIVFLDKTAPLDKARLQVADYNQKYHDLDKLRIANVFLGQANDVPVLVLRRFKDKKEAMRYITGTQKNAKEFINASEMGFSVLAISQNNYRNLLKDKRPDVYQEFFNMNYRGG